jgi:LysM repeat protein
LRIDIFAHLCQDAFKNTKIFNMSKWLMLVFFTFITSNILWAQRNKLEVRGTGSAIYLEHVVTPKENFYSVGRMFNINPKELAEYNHLHFASGLNIGQVLKIPLSKNNFTQEQTAAANEALIPIYHTVTAGETLYRLGVNYDKVSLASLKNWNHLTTDALSVGMPMIIGFLKVDKEQSPLANEEPMVSVPVSQPAVTQRPTPAQQPAATQQSELKGKDEEKTAVVNPVSKEATAVSATPTSQAEPAPQNNENKTSATITPTSTSTAGSGASTGYFKNLYERQTTGKSIIDKNGTAGVFKSTSGWQDAKYYCFSNDAAAGTILKVTNAATGKSVYAKVLDAIPDISQNDGLVTVISNAAAEQLGAGTDKFDCTVTFARQ